MAKIKAPRGRELAYATLLAVDKRGGSARSKELRNAVSEITGLTEGQLETLSMGTVQMRLGWARTGLKSSGHLDNSQRGVWSLTEKGRALLRSEPAVAQENARQAYESGWTKIWERKARRTAEHATESVDSDDDWKSNLLKAVGRLDPAGFERLALRLLAKAGFSDLEPIIQTGDGRIEGVGIYKRHLVSSRVYVQCQRWSGNVPAREIRVFQGAMAGRAGSGLFITTGSLARDARQAIKDGAQPIDLIDGHELCDLLKEYGLGVAVEMREHITVSQEFFDAV